MKRKEQTDNVARLLIISAIDISLLRFRGRLIEALIARGYKVFLAAPLFADSTRASLEALGAKLVEYPVNRTGLNPLRDTKTRHALSSIIRDNKIDLVFPYTVKPVIYGSWTAHKNGIAVVSLITGLGYGFSAASIKARMLELVLTKLYRSALRYNSAVIFQNVDDRQLFIDRRLLRKDMPTTVVDGSGVDLQEFSWREPRQATALRFVFAGRLIKEKGVGLFIDAAETLKNRWPEAEFYVLGDPQPGSPSSIDLQRLNSLAESGVVVHHRRRADIADFLSRCDVFVLPTYYREGVPRSILEALSTGMVVITTDTPGCRETVKNGENGYLVKPKDLVSLTTAMQSVLENPEQVTDMSRASRRLAEQRFDVEIVNEAIIEIIDSNLPARTRQLSGLA
ncbi:MAG: glycosyltransferase family 4 protein [Granulosicoccus sp.]